MPYDCEMLDSRAIAGAVLLTWIVDVDKKIGVIESTPMLELTLAQNNQLMTLRNARKMLAAIRDAKEA